MNNDTKNLRKGWLALFLIIVALVIDQAIKVLVKSNMYLGESIQITNWFFIDFIENKGMAFGMTFINKLFLSMMRVLVSCWIGWYIWRLIRSRARTCYIAFLSLIFAGAVGNILDSMFYGLIFSESTPYTIATLVPFGTGYAEFLTGRVVDMFYFPLITTTWPTWMPFVGGGNFVFFSPVFNFADACVSVGVFSLLLFCRKDLEELFASEKEGSTKDPINKKDADDQ